MLFYRNNKNITVVIVDGNFFEISVPLYLRVWTIPPPKTHSRIAQVRMWATVYSKIECLQGVDADDKLPK